MNKKTDKENPLIGAHMSIAGGVSKSLERGSEAGCRTIQIFTKNANQWKSKPLTEEEIRTFKQLHRETGIAPVVAHDSYLINIASPEPEKLAASREALLDEMHRVESLGIPYLVMHPGSHMGSGEEEGIRQIILSLNDMHEKTKGFKMKILLETTAGQGTNLGHRFEQVEQMISGVSAPERLGVCIDTCHIFAGGYDIRNSQVYKETMDLLFRLFGKDKILCAHVNDALKGFHSRVDRHAHIGKGEIGLEAFRCLMTDPRFKKVPKILETPKGDKNEMDGKNMAVLRKLASGK
jgi:deoxyribonuclease-4